MGKGNKGFNYPLASFAFNSPAHSSPVVRQVSKAANRARGANQLINRVRFKRSK